MRNKFMKFIATYLCLIFLSFFQNNLYSNEINLKAKEILTFEEGDIIIGKNEVEAKINGEFEIYADKITYNKIKNKLVAEGNVSSIDLINNIELTSQMVTFYKNKNEIVTSGETFFNIKKNYKGQSSDVNFLLDEKIIYSNKDSSFVDNLNNKITSSTFRYNDRNAILIANNIEFFDNEKNKYFLDKGFLKINENILLGKDVKINLRNNIFGTPENEPKLKGNSVISKNNKTLVKKGIFTSCKKNNNCPPWVITANEIIHDKEKKEIKYKNALLKIYNIPVLYFPKFFHPDPTVKRQSGFLIPKFESSSSLGDSISVPYFKVISTNKDLTFTPKIYNDSEGLFQSEFRQENKKSSHILDLGIKKNKKNTKSHFFSNSFAKFDLSYFENSELEVNIETTSNDNYLKSHKVKSGITNNNSLLNSFLIFRGNNQDFNFEAKVESYEDLTKEKSSDKYQYLLPSFEVSKNFNNNLNLISNGYQKNYNTNIFEKVLISDLKYVSSPKITNKGFINFFTKSINRLCNYSKFFCWNGFTSTSRVSRSLAGSTSPSGDSITTRYRRAPAVCGIIGSNNISCVTPGLRFTDDSLSFSSPINRLTRVDTCFENSLVTLAFSKRSSLATALGLRSEKVTLRSP